MKITLIDGERMASFLPDKPWVRYAIIAAGVIANVLKLVWDAMVILAVLKVLEII